MCLLVMRLLSRRPYRWPAFRKLKRLLFLAAVLLLYSAFTPSSNTRQFRPTTFELNESDFHDQSYSQVCLELHCVKRKQVKQIDRNRVTVVSAYFNIGTFLKGDDGGYFSNSLYLNWLQTYRLLLNDIIMFTDEKPVLELLRRLRNQTNQRSCFCLLRREQLWSFRLLPVLGAVLNQSDYPRFSPNTVLPEYGAAMHSKYAVMQLALQWNPFGARWFAWADVGIFRHLNGLEASEPPFRLGLPCGLDPARVAFTQVLSADFSLPLESYFAQNKVWVAGGFFLASESVMARWIQQYKTATFSLLRMGLSDTDQQVIYSMFTAGFRTQLSGRLRNLVHVQSYQGVNTDNVNKWFYLPFRSRLDWFRANCTGHSNCSHVTVKLLDCDKPRSFFAFLLSMLTT